MDDLKTILSGLAIIVSAISFVISYRHSRKTVASSMRPVLVFIFDNEIGWLLRNVGNGPALNIIVARSNDGSEWLEPVRIPPLPKDGQFTLHWLDKLNVRALAANYTDFQNRAYSTKCKDDLSEAFEKHILPRWSEEEVNRHWNINPPSPLELFWEKRRRE